MTNKKRRGKSWFKLPKTHILADSLVPKNPISATRSVTTGGG